MLGSSRGECLSGSHFLPGRQCRRADHQKKPLCAMALPTMAPTTQSLVYPENWPEHPMWGSILVYVLSRGAGKLAIDYLIARRLFAGT